MFRSNKRQLPEERALVALLALGFAAVIVAGGEALLAPFLVAAAVGLYWSALRPDLDWYVRAPLLLGMAGIVSTMLGVVDLRLAPYEVPGTIVERFMTSRGRGPSTIPAIAVASGGAIHPIESDDLWERLADGKQRPIVEHRSVILHRLVAYDIDGVHVDQRDRAWGDIRFVGALAFVALAVSGSFRLAHARARSQNAEGEP